VRHAPRWAWSVMLLAAAVVARADDAKPKDEAPKTAAEQYQALTKEFEDAQQEFMKAYQAAQSPEEKQKVLREKRPNALDYVKKFADLAEKYPRDPAAVDALVWVCTAAPTSPAGIKGMETLLKDHIKSEKIGPLTSRLAYAADGEKTLRKILNENPHRDVKGMATYNLAQIVKRNGDRGDEAAGKEAEKLFEEIAEKYADVKVYNRDLGKLAGSELREIRLLSVGKVAPDIEAEDIDGTKFKLSDYRGKVVMLDFWGHW